MKFDRILVSHFSPENGCNVPDGETLILRHKRKLDDSKSIISHKFEWHKKLTVKSNFGWVKKVGEFEFKNFLNQYGQKLSGDFEATEKMLYSIRRIDPKTVVAPTYFYHGVINKHWELKIHNVKFY